MDVIAAAYKALWNNTFAMMEWLERKGEGARGAVFAIGAILGVLLIESIYFRNADEVRLLFVILLIVPGALLGGAATMLLGGFFYLIVNILLWSIAVGLSIAPVIGIVYLLYATVVWKN